MLTSGRNQRTRVHDVRGHTLEKNEVRVGCRWLLASCVSKSLRVRWHQGRRVRRRSDVENTSGARWDGRPVMVDPMTAMGATGLASRNGLQRADLPVPLRRC